MTVTHPPTAALLDPSALRDPYPLYHQLRREAPVCWSPELQSWLLFRHADVTRALKDARLRAERVGLLLRLQVPDAPPGALDDYEAMLGRTCLMSDGEQHAGLRRIAGVGFLPAAIRAYRPAVEATVAELLDGVRDGGDLVEAFCRRLPAVCMARLLGVPERDLDVFQAWTTPATRLFGSAQLPLSAALEGQAGSTSMRAYFAELVERVQAKGGEPRTVIEFIVAHGAERGLDVDQVATLCVEVMGAAQNTSADVLGNAILALIAHPAQRERLLADPNPVPNGVDELMRYDGSVLFTNRVAAEPLELGGQQIEAGQLVTVMLAAANRDPEVFPEPDSLDVERGNANKQLGFGHGPHFCLGAPLARVMLAVALPALFRRFPTLQVEDVRWRPSVQLRGPEAMTARI